ncbi:MAG: ABC transporter permease [Anaerolineaceae bacterium]|jgi:ABC-2 type transport system permease protein|nr:MAG: ABC transporter permease [Anaerolineaceae bacterium]
MMRKVFAIAFKDLLRSMRSMFFIGISLAAPLLLAFLFSTAFGGGSSTAISNIAVAFVNLDVPPQGSPNLGDMVRDVFNGEGLKELISLHAVASKEEAVRGINDQEYSAALIIPANFSQAVVEEGATAQLRIISDPAASIAPQILENITASIADGFSSSKIMVALAVEELQRRGGQADEEFYTDVVDRITAQSQDQSGASNASLTILDPQGNTGEASDQQQIVSIIMVGMMIFFAFYTGAFASESLLLEEEKGTLARKFVSPTPVRTILAGKFFGVFITLIVQVNVLLLLSGLIFHIQWGEPGKIVLAVIALIVASASFGLLLMSLLRDSRQTGIILGGVMTVTGMLGGLFTTGIQNIPAFMDTLRKLTPQGWSLDLWQLVLNHASYKEILVPVAVLVGMGSVFFIIAVLRFQKRFAKR